MSMKNKQILLGKHPGVPLPPWPSISNTYIDMTVSNDSTTVPLYKDLFNEYMCTLVLGVKRQVQ